MENYENSLQFWRLFYNKSLDLKNAGLDVVFSIGLNAADYILRDDATLADLGVNSAADITKGFISLVSSVSITAVIVPATATVLTTGVVFAVVSFFVGTGLDAIDEEMGFSKDLTFAVEEYFK